jgi:glycine/D-amino acid oxidase-like deaminating enzyme
MRSLVVGGGVLGLASAYELAEGGADVTLLERGSVGAENSVRTGGGVRAQFGTAVNVRLSQASIPVWASFAERFGVDPDYRRPGYLFLARTEATAAGLRENVALQNDLGVASEYLDPETAREHCPELRAEQFVGAAYCETDGYLDHHRAVQGYHEAALEAGVEIRTGTPVVDVRRRDGRVVGVDTPTESLDADVVVNAAGAWGGRIAAMAGLDRLRRSGGNCSSWRRSARSRTTPRGRRTSTPARTSARTAAGARWSAASRTPTTPRSTPSATRGGTTPSGRRESSSARPPSRITCRQLPRCWTAGRACTP